MSTYFLLADTKMNFLPDHEWPECNNSEDSKFLRLFDNIDTVAHPLSDVEQCCFKPKSIQDLSDAIAGSDIENKNRYWALVKLMREKYGLVWIYISY